MLDQLKTIDDNLFDVISDIMDEKREDYARVARRARTTRLRRRASRPLITRSGPHARKP